MKTYQIKPNFVLRTIANERIVIPTDNAVISFSGIFTVNESGALLWRQLQNGASIETLTNALCEYYSIPRQLAEQDVLDFLKLLQKQDILSPL